MNRSAAVRRILPVVLICAAMAALVSAGGCTEQVARPPQAALPAAVTVTVNAAGKMTLEGQPVAGAEALTAALKARAAATKGGEPLAVTLKADAGVAHAQVAAALLACTKAGIDAHRVTIMAGEDGRGFFAADVSESGATHKVIYIVDRSGSMTDSMDFLKHELKRSVSDLPDDTQFHIIFFSSGPPVEMPTRRLVDATDRNKRLALEFIDAVVPQGETDPSQAIRRAFACKPDLIYLLTDGEFDREVPDLIRKLNADKKVTVHTISFLNNSGEAVLKQIAEENGGAYKFISEKDLENLGK